MRGSRLAPARSTTPSVQGLSLVTILIILFIMINSIASTSNPTPRPGALQAGVLDREIAMAKVAAPKMLDQVLDWLIQAHSATSDSGLGYAYARGRTMRIVDGPDEVHRNQIGRLELAQHPTDDVAGSDGSSSQAGTAVGTGSQ
jgi:alkylation response protein AidB-like acyl-CoA dehydrogenase